MICDLDAGNPQSGMDRLKQLETFTAVVSRGSLTAAALAEGVAPAVIGRRLDALEERLGVKLLVRTTRKLTEDMGTMEHEFLVEVKGEVAPEALKPIGYALKDERLDLPTVKVSVSSSTPEMSRLRFAIKGSHPGLIAFLCEKAGLQILAMKRIRLGRVTLADLPVGQWRYLAGWEKF